MTQSDLLSSPLQPRGSPYSPQSPARARRLMHSTALARASVWTALLGMRAFESKLVIGSFEKEASAVVKLNHKAG